MPLVRIDLAYGTTPEYRAQIGDVVYRAMTEVLAVPKNDRFQIITEHAPAGLNFDRTYLGIERSDACIFLQVTLNAGRSVETKQNFYRAVADGLHSQLGLRREDVFINLVEVGKADWSFGNGQAQYV
jgi:4-oxalocrotonate tautomerase